MITKTAAPAAAGGEGATEREVSVNAHDLAVSAARCGARREAARGARGGRGARREAAWRRGGRGGGDLNPVSPPFYIPLLPYGSLGVARS